MPTRARISRRRDAPPGASIAVGVGSAGEDPDRLLLLSAILFTLGSVGGARPPQRLRIFMWVELQLNAVNLSLVAFSRMHMELDGQILAFFSMVVAAAEVVVGLAIIVAVFRRRPRPMSTEADVLRG